jgi:hypothetical protein
MADFIFRVDHVHLTEHQQEKIASAIQGAVLTELARLDLHAERSTAKASVPAAGGPPSGGFLYTPISWRGGMMIGLDGVENAVRNTLTVAVRTEQTKAA